MTPRDTAVLYGPEILLMLAGAPVSKHVWWSSIAVAVLVSAVFAGTGLARGARAARCRDHVTATPSTARHRLLTGSTT